MNEKQPLAMCRTLTISAVIALLGSYLHAAEDMRFYGTSELMTPIRKLPDIPESGLMKGWHGYQVGKYGAGVSGVWSGKDTAWPGTKIYVPDVESDLLAVRFNVSGRKLNSGTFSTETLFHAGDLIFVGDGYRHITKMLPNEDPTRSDAVISLKSEWPDGVPKPEGLLLVPHALLHTWGGGGFLREVRSSKDDPQQLEAVLDLWDRFVRPVGYKPPDRQLVLTKGDEFEVKIVFRGGKRVVTPTSVGPGVTATGVGRIRCAGVYAPIPEKKFRGGVDLVPISLTITPVKN